MPADDDVPAPRRSRRARRQRTIRLRLLAVSAALLPLAVAPLPGLLGGIVDQLPTVHTNGTATCC